MALYDSYKTRNKTVAGSPASDEELTFMERLAILSASKAIREGGIDPTRDDVLFILSTTKGNVDLLEKDPADNRAYLAGSAQKIAEWFGNPNRATVVSNACISGVCAQIAAVRALLGGRCRTAVVIGCDVLSKFIISGFQSFKALSPEPCKPYDRNRLGLNLGEGAATLILQSSGNEVPSHSSGTTGTPQLGTTLPAPSTTTPTTSPAPRARVKAHTVYCATCSTISAQRNCRLSMPTARPQPTTTRWSR